MYRIKKHALPILEYTENNVFKIFMLDVGLISAKTSLDVRILLEGSKIFTEFRGALTEQFVLQELITKEDIEIRYWNNKNGHARIDFVAQIGSTIVPIEVKAINNLRERSFVRYSFVYDRKYVLILTANIQNN